MSTTKQEYLDRYKKKYQDFKKLTERYFKHQFKLLQNETKDEIKKALSEMDVSYKISNFEYETEINAEKKYNEGQ